MTRPFAKLEGGKLWIERDGEYRPVESFFLTSEALHRLAASRERTTRPARLADLKAALEAIQALYEHERNQE